MTSEPAAPRRSGRVAVLRRAYSVVLAAVLVLAVWSSRSELASLVREARPAPLAGALAVTFVQLWLSSLFWSSALTAFGAAARPAAVLDATVRSLPARYLPGSIWYPLGRAALLAADGVAKAPLAMVAVVEALLSVAVALCLGAALLAAAGGGAAAAPLTTAACGLLLVAMAPPVANPLLAWVARRRRAAAARLSWRAYAVLVTQMSAFWLVSAAAFVIYLAAFPTLDLGAPAAVGGAFLVAWGVGFLAVFAPQGLGVFEVTVAALLGGASIAGLAVVVAGFRALVGIRDAVAFAVASLRRR